MDIALWVAAGILAAMILFAGLVKAVTPKDKLRLREGMAWTEDVPAGLIRFVGVAEVLAAVGLILPRALDILPILTPIAAVGVAITMAGAVVIHLRRGETFAIVVPLVLMGLAIFVAWGLFAGW